MGVPFSTRAFLLSSAAMMLLAGTAGAADYPGYYAQPSFFAPTPAVSWGGFYLGANAGWVGIDSKATDLDGASGLDGRHSTALVDGGLFGGQVGYNWQSGAIVLGAEADFDASVVSGGKAFPGGEAHQSARLDDLETFRGRLGFLPAPDVLLFVTGGYAVGQIRASVASFPTTPPLAFRISGWESGWTVGGGVEWALNKQWTVKAEALYVSFVNQSAWAGDEVNTYPFKFQNSAALARAGVNFHF